MLGQNKTSAGPALLAQETAEINKLSERVSTAAQQLSDNYKTKTKAYETLAENAAKGRDKTGIAKCEGICLGYWDKFGTATSQFNHLGLNAAPAAAVLSADADLRARLSDVDGRSAKLATANKDLAAFYLALDNSSPPALLSDEIAAIRTAVSTKSQQYADLHSLTAFTLALKQTNQAFADLWAGKLPVPEARLPLVYGLLPGLCIVALGLYIKACLNQFGANAGRLGHLAGRLASESLAEKLLNRLEKLSLKNFTTHIRVNTRDFFSRKL